MKREVLNLIGDDISKYKEPKTSRRILQQKIRGKLVEEEMDKEKAEQIFRELRTLGKWADTKEIES